jgi:hypothetical protein
MLPPNAGNGFSRSYAEVEESESHLHCRQSESYTSGIEETQFVSVEPDTQFPDSYASHIQETQFMQVEKDTQALDESNFPSNHRDSQFPETNIPTASPNVTCAPAPLIARPNVGHIDDLAIGFTFKPAEKAEKGKFNRQLPPTPAKPQFMEENPSEEDKSNSKLHFQQR